MLAHRGGLPKRASSACCRAHHLIRKVPYTHRYHLTKAGRMAVTALSAARNANSQELTKMAA